MDYVYLVKTVRDKKYAVRFVNIVPKEIDEGDECYVRGQELKLYKDVIPLGVKPEKFVFMRKIPVPIPEEPEIPEEDYL